MVDSYWLQMRTTTNLRIFICLLIALNILIPLCFLAIPPGLGPEGDALDYRLPLINWALKHHAYPFFDWTYVDDFPSLAEIAMALAKIVVPWGPRVIAALGYCGFVYATHRVATFLLPPLHALLATALMATANVLTTQDNLIMVDNCASAFTLLGGYWLLRKRPVAAGIFTGLGLATRYTQFPFFVATVLVLLFPVARDWLRKKNIPQTECLDIVKFTGVAVLVVSPWLLRNFLHTGNPVYPLVTSLLGGHFFSEARRQEIFGMVATAAGFGTSPWAFLMLPFRFAFYKNAFDYSVGPLPLIFLPWWIAGKKQQPASMLWLAWLAAWFFTSQNARFLLPPLALLLCSSMAAAATLLEGESRFQRRARTAFLLLCLVMAAGGTAKHVMKHQPHPLLGSRNADAIAWLNAHSDEGAVALIQRSSDAHLLTADWIFVYPHVYSNSRYDSRAFPSVEHLLRDMKATARVAFLYVPSGALPSGLPPDAKSGLRWRLAFTGASGARIYRLVP